MTAHHEIELGVRLSSHHRGGIVEVLLLLSSEQIPVLTQSYCCDERGMLLLLTTSQPERAKQILETEGFECGTSPVVVVGPVVWRPLVAAKLWGELQRRGVDVLCSYISSTDTEHAFIIFKTKADDEALRWLHDAAVPQPA